MQWNSAGQNWHSEEEEERLARQDAEMAGWEKKEQGVGGEGNVVSSQEMAATANIREEPLERH